MSDSRLTLIIGQRGDLVAAIPHLLTFHPSQGLVLIGPASEGDQSLTTEFARAREESISPANRLWMCDRQLQVQMEPQLGPNDRRLLPGREQLMTRGR
jgi:hypothetical protein